MSTEKHGLSQVGLGDRVALYLEAPSLQLNKGEALHALREFLFFANKGTIRRKQEEEQTNQARCLNLLPMPSSPGTRCIWRRRLSSSVRKATRCGTKTLLISRLHALSI